jgi:hypothetical protein
MNLNAILSTKKRGIFSVMLMVGLMMAGGRASAQLRDYLNLPDHDSKKYYLGIGFLYDNSHFQVSAHPTFLASDSVLYVNPLNSGGFGVSGMFTFHVVDHLEFRFAFPEFIFSSNSISYHVKYPPNGEQVLATKQIQSLLLGFPAQVKFLSDRIGNFRVYMLGGINYRYDLGSNIHSRDPNLQYSNVIDKIKSRQIIFSIIFEG